MPVEKRGRAVEGMRAHCYPRTRALARVVQDVALTLVFAAIVIMRPPGKLWIGLCIAIPLVVGWGLLTLNFPTRVIVEEAAITFCGYGRAHRFAREDIVEVRVRRFVVRDRVLVRVITRGPGTPFRGRYWLLESIDGFDELVESLGRFRP